jgi:hypothetical protein
MKKTETKLSFRCCSVPGCGKPVFAHDKGRKCSCCRMRHWREMHPVRAMYHKVKWSAKLRDIPFKLTFAEFCEFDDVTDYVAQRTLAGEDITIDRVKELIGYERNNLQVLTRGENSAKSNQFRAKFARKRKLRKRRAA